jgi:hypothetical protein
MGEVGSTWLLLTFFSDAGGESDSAHQEQPEKWVRKGLRSDYLKEVQKTYHRIKLNQTATMKTTALFVLAALASANALAPSTSNRRAFLSKFAAGSVATVSVASTLATPAFAKDTYALDGIDEATPKKEAPKKSGDGGTIVGGALAASFALSLPFFAPNLARMAGVKNAKLPKK